MGAISKQSLESQNEYEKKRAFSHELEDHFKKIQQIANIGYWEYEIEQNIFYVSEQVYHLFGLPTGTGCMNPDQLLSFIHPDDQKRISSIIIDPQVQDIPKEIEVRIIRADCTERYMYFKQEIYQEQDRNIRTVGIIQDVTERKSVDQKLNESEQRYKSLIYYNPDGICWFDLSGKITGVNPVFEQMLGYTAEEFRHLTLIDILETSLDNKELFLQENFQGEFKQNLEAIFRHKDGRKVEVCYTLVPIYIHENLIGIYAIIKDVTIEKKTEELLRKSEKLSAIGQLAAGLAHEIRNPLTSLKGFIQLLQSAVDVEKKNSYLNIMENEIRRIDLFCSELLVLAKPQAKDFKQENLQLMVQSVVTLLDTQAILNNVQILLAIDDKLPMIYCNENQIKQVFVNIIKNAIEAMEKGGILRINVSKHTNQKILIQFIDTGKGIPDTLLSKIGEPFFTTKETGTGLGIMITQKIIENHKGTMEILSRPKNGTTVNILLPTMIT